ncbi:MAG: PLD nuclease N-terminal domain-containing protein [Chloroflexi bacterium]|nr:PLD nuclease N-terminal domain-containing protein [Chloroflexota bacterium]MCI0576470.1 PLD nuclease N-terminal domain-containing protein [Chloroflexota bacterium]MCI0649554.1 PLD nuclease N-terminal domain-containing protein [Chloroflexota bacterium]MCI0729370.1 PLD nuclease N-terminal domain-containing protein [Chloroflexota bacterium]
MSEQEIELLRELLPLLIPLALIQLGLMIVALVDLARRPATRGPKWVWVLVILFVNAGIGPILYFVLGRGEE